jgi:hypothetical protein
MQSEKRKQQKEREKEANKSLTSRKKEELARGIMERERDFGSNRRLQER